MKLFKRKRARAVRIQIHAYESARKPFPVSQEIIGGDRFIVHGTEGSEKMTILVHDDGSGVLDIEIVMQSLLITPSEHLAEMVFKQNAIIQSRLA